MPNPPASSRRPRSSEWRALRRALLILQRLAQSPARRSELIAYVVAHQPDAYPIHPSARDRAFKRDRDNLRRHLGAQVSYAPRTQTYALHHPGPLVALRLSERSLRALCLLSQTFTQPLGITLDLNQVVEPSPIPARVWETVLRERRALCFNYCPLDLAPQSKPRRYKVEAHSFPTEGLKPTWFVCVISAKASRSAFSTKG